MAITQNLSRIFLTLYCIVAISCEKEEAAQTNCKTCTETVLSQAQNQQSQTYVQSSVKYCNGEWTTLDGKVVKQEGTNNNGWWKKTITTECQ